MMYEKFSRFNKKNVHTYYWQIDKIQIGRNPYHIIPSFQFPIQLSTRCIVHYIRSLTFDHLQVDSTNVTRHF
jgi:hypothetical protein